MPNARSITEGKTSLQFLYCSVIIKKTFLASWFDICTKRLLKKKKVLKQTAACTSGLKRTFFLSVETLHIVGPDRHSIWLSAGSSLGRGFCRPAYPFTFRAGAHAAGVEEQLNLEQLQQVSGIHLHVVEEEKEGGMEGNYAEVQERIQCAGNETNMQPHLEID